MNTHADRIRENRSQSVSNGHSQKQSGDNSTFQFINNRPEAVAQRKLQEMAINSPRGMQLRAFQDMADNSSQAKQAAESHAMVDNYSHQQQQPIQKNENKTGLPENLKTGMENLSGMSLDDVKVHRNSGKPAQLQSHAYAQGTDIHLGPGQEKHLPHEAWHVVQQKQGRVSPTLQAKGNASVNDDHGLEKEADIMGAKAQSISTSNLPHSESRNAEGSSKTSTPIQLFLQINGEKQGGDQETHLETAQKLYESVLRVLEQPVPFEDEHFFRSLRTMIEWRKEERKDSMVAILQEWIAAPKTSLGADRRRDSMHAFAREYPSLKELAIAVLARADAQLKIEEEEAQATKVIESKVVKNDLSAFIQGNLKTFLNSTQPPGLDKNLMAVIEAKSGKYLPHMGKGLTTISEILETPNEFSVGMLIAAIHDITDILWANEEAMHLVTIPDSQRKSTVAKLRDGGLSLEREPYADKDWRGKSATPKESSAPIETARVLNTPVSMGPSNTTGRMMMLAQASGAGIESHESIAWGLFAFWYKEYRRELTDIHRQHFVMDMAANFGVSYKPGAPEIPTRFSVLERAYEHSIGGGTFADFDARLKPMLTDASITLLRAKKELSEIEKESVVEIEESTRKQLVSLALGQGWTQEMLTDSIVNWFDYVDEL